ncbi:CoA transferase [Variovorax sp. LT2P21]|uniref:CoA transferase n=1 Tax=Variovorax sp. LT2P21 TaxID=3443731 RepID=UPI003F4523DB
MTIPAFAPLAGTRVLSLALNLPGPAALMRCRAMGADCVKFEPPAAPGASADPMSLYAPAAYAEMHEGIAHVRGDLKTAEGRAQLGIELARTDVLITSFRPSALDKLGLGWEALHARHPRLSVVAIVGASGARAEEPGHDLTYLAESGLVAGCALPPTLYADMAGSLMASEAVLQALLHRSMHGSGTRIEVALSAAAHYLALPRQWGLTTPGGSVGGAHAGYRVYPCRDGRVALAALEPHFAQRLCAAAGLGAEAGNAMFRSSTHAAIAAFLQRLDCDEIEAIARQHDLPLHILRDEAEPG